MIKRKKRITYGQQYLDERDVGEVVRVLKAELITQGPKVLEFEKALAKYCGAKYAVAVSHGTAALHLAYLAAGFKKGDEVITTPNTFVATTNMLLEVGVKPVFCDIRLDTYNIDETKIEKLITKRTKAIIPVHFAGNPCEMAVIRKIAKKHKFFVIEDACHALGAKFKNSRIGNCRYSDMAVFSFHPVKSITTGEGGAILTNNKKLYEKLILFRNHGIYKDKKGKNIMIELGYNYRMTDIQATLGCSQLRKLDNFIQKRHEVVNWYRKELNNIKEIILPIKTSKNYSAWHIYVIRVRNLKLRYRLMRYLDKYEIGINFHYPAVYSHPYYKKNDCLPRWQAGKNIQFKNEEKYQNTCITIPLHIMMTKEEVKYIAQVIKLFFKK